MSTFLCLEFYQLEIIVKLSTTLGQCVERDRRFGGIYVQSKSLRGSEGSFRSVLLNISRLLSQENLSILMSYRAFLSSLEELSWKGA